MRTSVRPWPRMQTINREKWRKAKKQKNKQTKARFRTDAVVSSRNHKSNTQIAEMTPSQRQTFAYFGLSLRILVNLQIRGKERPVDKKPNRKLHHSSTINQRREAIFGRQFRFVSPNACSGENSSSVVIIRSICRIKYHRGRAGKKVKKKKKK